MATRTTQPAPGTVDLFTLHGLVEAQARSTPDATSVICGDRQLSYRELDRGATAVARRLRRHGVERGALVGLHVQRSLQLAVGMLGIVKAGAAYVPLDPSYPADRLAFMIDDAGVEVILTDRCCGLEFPQGPHQVLCFEDSPAAEPDVDHFHLDDDVPLDTEADGGDLAYVIYTSGSTGQPKGVMIEHQAVVNTILDINRRFAVGPSDRVLGLSSYGFDLSVYDMFGMWAAGGSVVLPEPDSARSPRHWAELVSQHQVSIWNSVPAALEMLVTHQSGRQDATLDSLRLVLLSGDWIPLPLPDRVRTMSPASEVVSLGGATEASIWSVLYPIGQRRPEWNSIPYGRAMENQSIHVLNEQLIACPVGEVGQLYLGGTGLARGYWRRPELTAERFITGGVGELSATRLYATGDLGRLHADGTIEFLGRMDNQVKIRGHRVELGEVEAALCRHPAIHQAVALAIQRAHHKQLVAFVAAPQHPRPQAAELRQFLERTLPEYLVPARFVVLDQLPLTANEKVDRAALATWDAEQLHRPDLTAPRNDTECRLVRLWQEVFEIEPLGIDDDFFELGGDSLLAAALVARVEHEFGRQLSPDALVERPTVRRMADELRMPHARSAAASIVTIQAGGDRAPLFCMPGIGGNVLEFRSLARRLGADRPVYGLRPAGQDDGLQPHTSIAEMAAHGIEQMRTIARGPYHLAGYSLGGVVAFEMAHQLVAAGEQVALLALVDSQLSPESTALSLPRRLRIHCRSLLYGEGGRWSYLRTRGRLLANRIRRGTLRHDDEDLIASLDLTHTSRNLARRHIRAMRDYEPKPYDGRLTLFVAQYEHPASLDATLGWSRWTTLPVDVHLVPSTHAEILRRKELQVLAEQLCDA